MNISSLKIIATIFGITWTEFWEENSKTVLSFENILRYGKSHCFFLSKFPYFQVHTINILITKYRISSNIFFYSSCETGLPTHVQACQPSFHTHIYIHHAVISKCILYCFLHAICQCRLMAFNTGIFYYLQFLYWCCTRNIATQFGICGLYANFISDRSLQYLIYIPYPFTLEKACFQTSHYLIFLRLDYNWCKSGRKHMIYIVFVFIQIYLY